MSAVLCTTVNSYKRLADGHRAPRHATWARVSQASLIRVPAFTAGSFADLELRSPDAMANPYLAIASPSVPHSMAFATPTSQAPRSMRTWWPGTTTS